MNKRQILKCMAACNVDFQFFNQYQSIMVKEKADIAEIEILKNIIKDIGSNLSIMKDLLES
ncbi:MULTISPECIES: hypothetical protein [Cysteiniphilum]|uniref:hypothetical protein n=1 Tax=Cysteiniphilum TaxID=2056696 RepID=UPI001785525A|nr:MULTISPECIES: hypothetical protein [Cysteiniphilum]